MSLALEIKTFLDAYPIKHGKQLPIYNYKELFKLHDNAIRLALRTEAREGFPTYYTDLLTLSRQAICQADRLVADEIAAAHKKQQEDAASTAFEIAQLSRRNKILSETLTQIVQKANNKGDL